MKKNTPLFISGAFNAVLLAGLVTIVFSDSPSTRMTIESVPEPVLLKTPNGELDENNSSASKLLRLQELEFQYRDSLPPPPDRYWEPGQTAELANYLQLRLDADRFIRDQIVAEFGESARTSAEFRSVFFPLDMQHPYLSSENQIRLREHQGENQIEFLKQQRVRLAASSHALGASPVVPNPQNSIEQILDSEALYEYGLRTSPLAKRIADAELGLNELQFRQTYSLLEAAMRPSTGTPVKNFGAIRSDLKLLIGEELALKVIAALDSGFDSIKLVGQQHGLSEQQVLQAYEVFADTDKQIFAAYDIKERDAESYKRMVGIALAERHKQLSHLLGEDVATALIKARSSAPTSERRAAN